MMDVIKHPQMDKNKNTTLSNLARCRKHRAEKAKSCCGYAISEQCEQSEALYRMSPIEHSGQDLSAGLNYADTHRHEIERHSTEQMGWIVHKYQSHENQEKATKDY